MGFLVNLLMVLLLVMAVFLIVLVLIQRGKGGGLAGAFGGMGGQSAFGTKAGDLFTRITIVVAALWIVLCMITVKVLSVSTGGPLDTRLGSAANAPASTDKGASQKTPTGTEKPATDTGKPAENKTSKTPAK
jgi:preprotein translocase subunit SecG